MKKRRILRTCGILSAVLICVTFLVVGLCPVRGEEAVYESVVRLHVLANSDGEEDQARKLLVRDAILEMTAPLMEGCESREAAVRVLEENRVALIEAAEATLRREGCEDRVTVTLSEEEYPERRYDSFCFPSGEYVSLRVMIGEAEGQNWWCCLYPPLCRSAATVGREEGEEAFIEVGLTPSQYKIITETEKPVYKARFKLLELIKGLF